jgi:hypothetical protein
MSRRAWWDGLVRAIDRYLPERALDWWRCRTGWHIAHGVDRNGYYCLLCGRRNP